MSRFKLQHICKLQIYILQSILFTFHDKHNICFDIPQRVTTFSKGVLMERMKGQLKLSIVDIVTWTNCPLTIGPEWDRFYFKKIKGKVLKVWSHSDMTGFSEMRTLRGSLLWMRGGSRVKVEAVAGLPKSLSVASSSQAPSPIPLWLWIRRLWRLCVRVQALCQTFLQKKKKEDLCCLMSGNQIFKLF